MCEDILSRFAKYVTFLNSDNTVVIRSPNTTFSFTLSLFLSSYRIHTHGVGHWHRRGLIYTVVVTACFTNCQCGLACSIVVQCVMSIVVLLTTGAFGLLPTVGRLSRYYCPLVPNYFNKIHRHVNWLFFCLTVPSTSTNCFCRIVLSWPWCLFVRRNIPSKCQCSSTTYPNDFSFVACETTLFICLSATTCIDIHISQEKARTCMA